MSKSFCLKNIVPNTAYMSHCNKWIHSSSELSWWNRWEPSYINWPRLSTCKHILQGCSKAPRTELGDSGNSHCYSNGETVLPINSASPLSAVVLKWSAFAAEGVSGSVWRHCLMSWLRMGRSVLPASHEWAETRKATKHPVMHRPAPSPPPSQHQRIIQSKIPNSAGAEKSCSGAVALTQQSIAITWRGPEPRTAGIYPGISNSVGLGCISI